MKIKVEGFDKEVKIPDEDIARIVKGLDVTEEEAIQIWLEDEGYMVNEEQEALCKKGKENRITATIHKAKGTEKKERAAAARPPNETKEGIIAMLADALKDYDNVTNLVIENKGKLITFAIGDDEFKLDLVQKRKKK